MSDISKLRELLNREEEVLCLLAPSFVADFDYPKMIWDLKKAGFKNILELTFGAKMVNLNYHRIIQEDEDKTWIASPCPTIVKLIQTKYPHLVDNLIPIHSPMGAMALICEKYYPDSKMVFIGPCLTKKIEIQQIGMIELGLTFREIQQFFDEEGIDESTGDAKTFEKFYNDYTKIYPLAGGLSKTLHYKNILKEEEILIEDGIGKITEILDAFEHGKYKHYRFFDCLACKEGCIGGPGMKRIGSTEEKVKRVKDYRKFARRYEKDLGRRGKKLHVEGIDFSRSY